MSSVPTAFPLFVLFNAALVSFILILSTSWFALPTSSLLGTSLWPHTVLVICWTSQSGLMRQVSGMFPLIVSCHMRFLVPEAPVYTYYGHVHHFCKVHHPLSFYISPLGTIPTHHILFASISFANMPTEVCSNHNSFLSWYTLYYCLSHSRNLLSPPIHSQLAGHMHWPPFISRFTVITLPDTLLTSSTLLLYPSFRISPCIYSMVEQFCLSARGSNIRCDCMLSRHSIKKTPSYLDLIQAYWPCCSLRSGHGGTLAAACTMIKVSNRRRDFPQTGSMSMVSPPHGHQDGRDKVPVQMTIENNINNNKIFIYRGYTHWACDSLAMRPSTLLQLRYHIHIRLTVKLLLTWNTTEWLSVLGYFCIGWY